MSEHDSICRTIKGKGMQHIRREIPAYADPNYRPPPKPTEIPTQVTPIKFWTQTLSHCSGTLT